MSEVRAAAADFEAEKEEILAEHQEVLGVQGLGFRVQGYLAHKKQRPSKTLQ